MIVPHAHMLTSVDKVVPAGFTLPDVIGDAAQRASQGLRRVAVGFLHALGVIEPRDHTLIFNGRGLGKEGPVGVVGRCVFAHLRTAAQVKFHAESTCTFMRLILTGLKGGKRLRVHETLRLLSEHELH